MYFSSFLGASREKFPFLLVAHDGAGAFCGSGQSRGQNVAGRNFPPGNVLRFCEFRPYFFAYFLHLASFFSRAMLRDLFLHKKRAAFHTYYLKKRRFVGKNVCALNTNAKCFLLRWIEKVNLSQKDFSLLGLFSFPSHTIF